MLVLLDKEDNNLKKPKELFVLISLSLIATLYRVYDIFFSRLKEPPVVLTGDREIDGMMRETQEFARQQFSFDQNSINRMAIVVLLFLLMLGLAAYIRKKWTVAYVTYIGYIFLNAIHFLYKYWGFKSLFALVQFPEAQELFHASAQLKLHGGILTFIVYIGIVFYSWLRQEKQKSIRVG